jgi:hypothetical protein
MPLAIVECPSCQGEGRRITGFSNRGEPQYGGDCLRCGRSGFVPLLDGEPSFPFGRDKDHPALQIAAGAAIQEEMWTSK